MGGRVQDSLSDLLSPTPSPGLTCAILCVIVIAKNTQCLSSPNCHLG